MAERSAKQLGLIKADLPNSIIEVIATLTKGGFEAFIVGGGVRDTLLGLNPKDFDAVTDAKPHEIKDLFGKRCRIIGRRFKLAHVYSGRDMIEVATFRAPPQDGEHTTNDGMIVRDNVWGDIKQDFSRRDFSINAMYYEPIKGVVHDFCNALDDIDNKVIRLLGNAPVRIEEDPVRLLRALRFKAKLGFEFDDVLEKQFHDDNWKLLDQVSPHRLYDESQKMFTGGYLVPLLPLLFDYGAIEHLIIYPPKTPTRLVSQVAINTDKRIALGKSINPAFFYAALLWDNYLHQLTKFKKQNLSFQDAQMQASIKVIERQRIKTAIPRFAEQFIRDIWLMQPKLSNPRVKQIAQLAEHARFRAAFDFLLLREQCDDAANPLSESTNGMGEWWQTYQTLTDKEKQQAINDFADDSRRAPNKSSRNRRRDRNKSTEVVTEMTDNAQNRKYENEHFLTDKIVTNNHASQSNDAISAHKKYDAESSNSVPSEPMISDNMQNKTQSTQGLAPATSHPVKRPAPRPRSAGQKRHDAQERAQLKKLSLQRLSDETSESKQPKPLFQIDAKKLAQQLTNQQSDKQQSPTHKTNKKKGSHQDSINLHYQNGTQSVDANKTKSDIEARDNLQSQPNPQQTTEQDRSNHNQLTSLKSDYDLTPYDIKDKVVVLPKAQVIPNKRRRRKPSQQLSQNEMAEVSKVLNSQHQTDMKVNAQSKELQTLNKKSAADETHIKTVHSDYQSQQTSTSNQFNSSKQPSAKQKLPSDVSTEQTVSASTDQQPVTPAKSQRVPEVRRRRAPSGTQTVREREK